MTRNLIIVGIRGGEGQARAEAQALLDYAGHRPTCCNVDLMSLAGHWPKSESRHVYLIMDKTGQWGPVLLKSDKSVNDAARQVEGGPAEAEGFSVSSQLLLDNAR